MDASSPDSLPSGRPNAALTCRVPGFPNTFPVSFTPAAITEGIPSTASSPHPPHGTSVRDCWKYGQCIVSEILIVYRHSAPRPEQSASRCPDQGHLLAENCPLHGNHPDVNRPSGELSPDGGSRWIEIYGRNGMEIYPSSKYNDTTTANGTKPGRPAPSPPQPGPVRRPTSSCVRARPRT